MGFLRRHKPEPIDMTPPDPPDRVSLRLAELAEEYARIENARKADLNRQLDRAGVNVWAGFLREEQTVCLPTVQPRELAQGEAAG